MARPIEQRVGGPNSIRTLVEKGLSREGIVRKTREVVANDGTIVKVNPVIVWEGDREPFTLLKPATAQLNKI